MDLLSLLWKENRIIAFLQKGQQGSLKSMARGKMGQRFIQHFLLFINFVANFKIFAKLF